MYEKNRAASGGFDTSWTIISVERDNTSANAPGEIVSSVAAGFRQA
jgi:hypothetical protein